MRIHFFVTAAVLLAMPISAKSHTHVSPDGTTVTWYPKDCCHDRDCRPVATVRPTAHGLWMTTVDGQTVLVEANQQRRPSLDMRWHICLGKDAYENTIVECLFEPPNT
jgi:hypothetical protein